MSLERRLSTENFWPMALTDNFTDDWPDLTNDDGSIEKWVYDNKKVLLRVVTWNHNAKVPPPIEVITKTLLPVNKFHVYIFGSEECERSIAQSAINPSKKNWESYLNEAMGPWYVPLRSHTLQAIHIIAFVHKCIAPLCSVVTSAAVATGTGNTLGNKGGVGIYMKIGLTSFLVVNAHLAAHQENERQRNMDFDKINKTLPMLLERKEARESKKMSGPTHSGVGSRALSKKWTFKSEHSLNDVFTPSSPLGSAAGRKKRTDSAGLADEDVSGLAVGEAVSKVDIDKIGDLSTSSGLGLGSNKTMDAKNEEIEESGDDGHKTTPQSTVCSDLISCESDAKVASEKSNSIPAPLSARSNNNSNNNSSSNALAPITEQSIEGKSTSGDAADREEDKELDRRFLKPEQQNAGVVASFGGGSGGGPSNGQEGAAVSTDIIGSLASPGERTTTTTTMPTTTTTTVVTTTTTGSPGGQRRKSFSDRSDLYVNSIEKSPYPSSPATAAAERGSERSEREIEEAAGMGQPSPLGNNQTLKPIHLKQLRGYSTGFIDLGGEVKSSPLPNMRSSHDTLHHTLSPSANSVSSAVSAASAPIFPNSSSSNSSSSNVAGGGINGNPSRSHSTTTAKTAKTTTGSGSLIVAAGGGRSAAAALLAANAAHSTTTTTALGSETEIGAFQGTTGADEGEVQDHSGGSNGVIGSGIISCEGGGAAAGGPDEFPLKHSLSANAMNSVTGKTIDQCAEVVIFMGDLNYRIKGNRSIIDRLLDKNMFEVLHTNDQLRLNMEQGNCFQNFKEAKLHFKPTYKLQVGSDEYDTSGKNRIPSWTDRILFSGSASGSKNAVIECTAYNSDTSISTSDHKPVYASFEVSVRFDDSVVAGMSETIKNKVAPQFIAESQVCTIM